MRESARNREREGPGFHGNGRSTVGSSRGGSFILKKDPLYLVSLCNKKQMPQPHVNKTPAKRLFLKLSLQSARRSENLSIRRRLMKKTQWVLPSQPRLNKPLRASLSVKCASMWSRATIIQISIIIHAASLVSSAVLGNACAVGDVNKKLKNTSRKEGYLIH